MTTITRRRFVTLTAVAAAAASAGAGEIKVPTATESEPKAVGPSAGSEAPAVPEPPPLPPVHAEFPTQPPALAREMVGVSHANLNRVKELLAVHPTLANATWDWGFGDWESALGAASHVGRPDIARLLLDHGARPSIFSAAMLGQLSVVRAFVEASPGVQSTPGPHGITLLAHARAGGDAAKAVVDYLVTIGAADQVVKRVELSPETLARYVGTYVFGPGDTERVEIKIDDKGSARFTRAGTSARVLVPLGDGAFYPVGAPKVRIQFVMEGETAQELTVFDPELVLRARRLN